jgi:RNA polymerase sigma factor (sigma-70 family)
MTAGPESASAAARADDLKLVARCLDGERAAQRELFQREKRRVHATLYRIMGHNQGIEDVLQDTFLAVFRSLHQFRGEARLSTWIDRCAVRVAYHHLQHSRRARLEVIAESTAAAAPSPEERMLTRETARRLYEILAGLPPKLRIAYVLHVLDDRTLPEVAALLGTTLVATKLRVWRARQHVERRAQTDPLLGDFMRRTRAEALGAEADS